MQLAGYVAPDETPRNDHWPQLRYAQLKTARTVPKTGIVVATNIGDQNDLHPKNKQDAGLRLARLALANDYGKQVECSGPTLKTIETDGARLVLKFDHARGDLTIKGEANRVFALAGADKQFHWATAKVEGPRVVLIDPEVKAPVAARYGRVCHTLQPCGVTGLAL